MYFDVVVGTSKTMAMEESTFPRLIVPASHTALSGDLTVIILDFPSINPIQTQEELTTTTSTRTTNSPTDGDNEDYELTKNEHTIQGPYILRFVKFN